MHTGWRIITGKCCRCDPNSAPMGSRFEYSYLFPRYMEERSGAFTQIQSSGKDYPI